MSAKFLACLAALAVGVTSFAQGSLTIGDPAPTFKPEGWVKGTPVPEFQKGKVYVVEFWATWCGPCIASMPHLSDMADKWKGKIEFISVNTWDRNQPGEKEAKHAGHVERVTKFVTENDGKMRYNIALDDEKDTISTTWMRAAGRNGIPCAFVVDQEGQVAWIGHPMEMEKPVEQVFNKTFDKATFKKKFDEEAAVAKAQQKLSSDIMAAAKIGDKAKFDELLSQLKGPKPNVIMQAASMAANVNAAFALSYVEPLVGKVDGLDPASWCSILSSIVHSAKADDVKDRALALSAGCADKADSKLQAIAFGMHARSLAWAGKKTEAKVYLDKAKSALGSYEPAEARDSISKFLDSIEKSLTN